MHPERTSSTLYESVRRTRLVIMAVMIMATVVSVSLTFLFVHLLDLRPIILKTLAGEILCVFGGAGKESSFAAVAAVINLATVGQFRE